MSSDTHNAVNLSAEEKRTLIKERLQARLKKKALAPKTCPLAFAQQRLWFLHQLDADNSNYNIPLAVRLKGRLDELALEQSVNEIVRRHETLRTTFHLIDGQPMQVIAPPSDRSLSVVDLRELAEDERETEVRRLAQEEAHRPFDLTEGPLFRVGLLRICEDDHVLLFTMPHIITDGWSIGVLVRELTAIYAAFSTSTAPPLPELSIQYADFAQWQRSYLTEEVLEEHLLYWKNRMTDAPTLELPTDRPRLATRTTQGARYFFSLPPSLSEAVNAFSRSEGVTVFMVLLAAFKVLLSRYTGQRDIVVGTPIAGRTRTETEALIGLFVNTLVLRTKWAGEVSFRELMREVREGTLEAYAHQELPFEKLVEQLQPERSLSRTPLFQVVFVMQNTAPSTTQLPGLDLKMFGVENTTAKFDLTLSIESSPQGLEGSFEYSTDLFEEATIARMAGHFQNILRHVVPAPHQLVSDIPLLSAPELHQLLVERNDTSAPYPHQTCLHELFEAQVKQTPNSPALTFDDETLTYRELNARANQLAHHLRGLGAAPEQLIAILMERSSEMVISLLAVLKAGAAYLPLDPTYPAQRLSYMLADSGASILLTQEELIPRLPEHEAQVIVVEQEWSEINKQSEENPPPLSMPDNLAYIIYTSGSTGQPKGVTNTHGNVVRLFAETDSWFHFDASDVWTLFHSLAFDFSVWEIWGALLYGGRLVVVPYLISRTPEKFYQLICDEGVTVLNQTPSAFRLLSQAADAAKSHEDKLRYVIFGGEALEFQSLHPWLMRKGDEQPQLINMYGITETTVHVTYRRIRMADLEAKKGSIIGAPIPDLRVYVLDEKMQPVPIGVAGELYIGGAGLARGYLRLPALTAQRFIPDPFATTPGARLYRSGDLARFLPDLELEYLGRLDHQVKVRGFRIELGEVESALVRQPGISRAVVVARQEAGGEQRLVAYLVMEEAEHLQVREVRRALAGELPEYMIPQAYVELGELPLTANGKVDRRRLPEPEQVRGEMGQEYVAPRTSLEEAIALAWAEILGLDQVGIYDNFFELGGDSIRSIQVRAKAQQYGVDFTIQQLFQYQNIYELAQAINASIEDPVMLSPSVPFDLIGEEDRRRLPEDLEDAYPLTRLQLGMLFHSEYYSDSSLYHNVSSIQLKAPLDVQALEAALEQLADLHPILRTSFDLSNYSEPMQLVHKSVRVPLEVEDIGHLSATEQEEMIEQAIEVEKGTKFNLTRAPLLRFKIHRRSPQMIQITWAEHHAILDGWSVAVMLTDLFHLYFALLGDPVKTVEPQQVSFRDFVALERAALASEETRRYWGEKLEDSVGTMLPRRAPALEEGGGQHRSLEVDVPREVSEGLKKLSQHAGVPLKSVLLAAHLRVLSLLGGNTDVVTGLVANGRPEEQGGERVLGLFLNTLPFRLKLDGGTWVELARRTFEVEREMMPHRRYPMAELQKLHGQQPLFSTAFNFVHFHVYENLRNFDRIEIVEGKSLAETNFAFEASYSLDVVNSQIQLGLFYDTSEFCAEEIQPICGYYARTLAAMAREPLERYELSSPLSQAEQKQLLEEWNGTSVPRQTHRCVHQLFSAQAARTPHAPAVSLLDQQLTYRELNERANQVAALLRRKGVGLETRVGLYVERSVEMVVGLLGVLKAGGAYVPLEASNPAERLKWVMEDAALRVVLTQGRLRERLPAGEAEVICLDEGWDESGAQSAVVAGEEAEEVEVWPESLAYIIYTSGSTGMPKGVMVQHKSLSNYIDNAIERFDLKASDRVLQFASISFDTSAEEIYPCLAVGAHLVLRSESMLGSVSMFLQRCDELRLTVLDLPTAYWHELAIALSVHTLTLPPSIRLMIIGGERALPERLQAWRERAGSSVRLLNTYGPTETTIVATMAEVGEIPATAQVSEEVSIGRAIHGVTTYVLDKHLQPSPVATPGELYIGGEGLARGYLGRAALTAERFIPHPFTEKPGARLYRTGDLVRYLPGGELEFLGRADQQVKIRGFRVELSEIEATLRRHPLVLEAVVVAREGMSDARQLLAYVVPNTHLDGDGQSADESFVAEHVQQWKAIFDDLYAEVDSTQQPSLYVKGWEDSYTGQPIPTVEVEEWADHTAERILSLCPNRLMEIGCGGSGLMLFRLSPHCTEYFATDLSENSLHILRHQLADTGHDLSNITLKQRDAANFEGIAPRSFDTLIIVSVAQYFPDINYLVSVLEGAVRAVAPGGKIFIGDLRSLPLLEAFHASVQLSRAPDALPTDKLRQRVQQELLREKQLVIDPLFFTALQEHLPEISHIEILLERGRAHNELTKYRYDAILHIRRPDDEPVPEDVDRLDWERDRPTLARVRQWLTEKEPRVARLSGMPNARLLSEVEAVRLLKTPERHSTVGELREALRHFEGEGIDPEDLWSLGEELSYTVSITYSSSGADGKCDVIMTRGDVDGARARRALLGAQASRTRVSRSWSDYANAPAQGMVAAEIVPKLRSYLLSQLPDYMLPSAFVLQNSLPLTPSGKVDRRALPMPDNEAIALLDTYVAPRDTLELELTQLWEEVLGIEPVGVESNFFELGGHSLLAVRLFALIERKFDLKLPLAVLFRAPTIAQLAGSLRPQTNTVAAPSALVEIRSGGSKKPFFCVHPISGNVLCYADLSRHLGADQPFYALQSVGIEGEEFAHTRIEEMAAHYIEALRVVQPAGPYLLGGWSMGGSVAYEMAQQLHAQGQEVSLLALIDSYAPPLRHQIEDEASLLTGFAQDLGLPLEKLSISSDQFHALPPDEQLSYALEAAKQAKVIHSDVSPEQIRRLYNLFKINVKAMKSYLPRPYGGRVTLFSAREKPPGVSSDPTLGWANLAIAGADVHDVPGDHYSMVREPHVKTLAQRLTACLHLTVAE